MRFRKKGLGFLTGILLLLMPMMLVTTSCTKGNFDAFFREMDKTVPLEQVNYKIPLPDKDTVITWYAPYDIFKNRTEFANDTIYHQEKFNWSGLGDFLWQHAQKYKERRKQKKNLDTNITMIPEIYQEIAERIASSEDPVIKHVDLWNRQPQNEAIETAYPRPAAFVHIRRIVPSELDYGRKSYDAELSIYLEQVDYRNTALGASNYSVDMLKATDKLSKWLDGYESKSLTRLRLVEIQLDEDFSNKIVHRLDFTTSYTGCCADCVPI